jgi:hypothetical protein
LIWITAFVVTFPEIVEPALVTVLATPTVIYSGKYAGGLELLPPVDVQLPPHAIGFGVPDDAYPLKLDGAGPPLSELSVNHCGPQNVTVFPTTAF